MPPEKAEVVGEWLAKAAQDLDVAHFLLASQPKFAEIAVFHAQQAAEKSLKAFLTAHDIRFRKIHDMNEIGNSILKIDSSLHAVIERAKTLNPFAVEIRYPGEEKPVSIEEAKKHLATAKQVNQEVLKRLPNEAHPRKN